MLKFYSSRPGGSACRDQKLLNFRFSYRLQEEIECNTDEVSEEYAWSNTNKSTEE